MSEIVLEAREVSKQYPGTLALDRVDFKLVRGTVTALIGENGAGKSTLVRILGGIERPTGGRLLADGDKITLHSVRDAEAQGIGIIHQELNLCPNLNVAENIFLGHELVVRGLVDHRAQKERAKELMDLLEHPIDPSALVGDLPLGRQQIVEIAKAIARDVRVLMMDEPTSALSASEVGVLFGIIRQLAARGVAIVYISHRLEELLAIADSVSVLRDGRMIAEARARDINTPWIVERMTGRPAGVADTAVGNAAADPEILRVESLSLVAETGRPVLRDVSMRLRAGEVLGLYGLMGAGRTEFLECLMGLHPELSGSILLDSRRLDGLSTADRILSGLAMVPEDRQVSGLVQSLSVRANITLSSLDRLVRGAWLSPELERRAAAGVAADLRVKSPGIECEIGALSGGNQQKVVIARCLLTEPRVLLLDEPTRGVDIGAKGEIHAIVKRLAAAGMGIIVVSSELDEVRAVAHRIVVMSRGAITGEFAGPETTDEALAFAASSPATRETGEGSW